MVLDGVGLWVTGGRSGAGLGVGFGTTFFIAGAGLLTVRVYLAHCLSPTGLYQRLWTHLISG